MNDKPLNSTTQSFNPLYLRNEELLLSPFCCSPIKVRVAARRSSFARRILSKKGLKRLITLNLTHLVLFCVNRVVSCTVPPNCSFRSVVFKIQLNEKLTKFSYFLSEIFSSVVFDRSNAVFTFVNYICGTLSVVKLLFHKLIQ